METRRTSVPDCERAEILDVGATAQRDTGADGRCGAEIPAGVERRPDLGNLSTRRPEMAEGAKQRAQSAATPLLVAHQGATHGARRW